MLSFENYYNFEPGRKKYELMKDEGIVLMLQYIDGDEKTDIDSINPQKAAESYLEGIGLDQPAIVEVHKDYEKTKKAYRTTPVMYKDEYP